MKLLFITEFFPSDDKLVFTGGVESYNYYLVQELAKRNSVTVICRKKLPKDKKIEYRKNLKIIRLGTVKKIDTSFSTIPERFLFSIEAVRQGIREDFDIVQGNNFVTYPITYIIGFLKNKPKIAWFPDVFVGKWRKITNPFSALLGEFTERATLVGNWDHIISLSSSTTTKLLSQNIKKEKITTIYAGVDSKFFSKIKVKKNKKFTICCIGRLVSYKRIDLLLDAGNILKNKGYDFSIVVIGSGPEEFALRLQVKKLNLQKYVLFKSNLKRKELASVLKSSHLFCLPSQEEGFGLVIIEASSCKLPYVITNIPVLKEVTQNGKGGLFFKKGDAGDLATKIEVLLQDKKKRKFLGDQAYLLSQNYSWKNIASQFETVYESILKKPIKVLMLIDAWFPHVGGGQVHVWELSKKLADLGCQITIYTRDLGEWSNQYPSVTVKRVGHFKQFSNLIGRLEYLFLAQLYVLFNDYDILHAHAFSPGLLVPLVKIFRKKKTIFTAHGSGMKISGLPIGEKFLEELVFYKIHYDALITVAKNTFKGKPKTGKFITIPNGVDIKKFSLASKERKSIKHIIYVGRLVYDKGVDLLIQAFLNQKNKRIDLTIVGEGEELPRLKKMAKRGNIRFVGTLVDGDLVQRIKKADLLVLPSRVEGMPIRLLEAWSAHIPVIATNVGDNTSYIEENKTGFLAEPNSDSLQRVMMKALNSKKIKEIAQNGYKKVQKFTWDKIASQTFNVYKEVLNERS